MPTCYSYVRFSTARQHHGDSLRRQLKATTDYCERHKLALDDTLRLRDLGVSGFNGKNVKDGALAGFLEAVKLGKIARGSTLIIESIDRLGRDQVPFALKLFLDLLMSGIEIVTLTPERRYSMASVGDVAGLLEPIVYMSRAFEESATKSVRVSAAWGRRVKEVRDGTRATANKKEPFWVDVLPGGGFKLNRHADTIRLVFKLLTDGMGYGAVARELVTRGHRTPVTGGVWTSFLVRQTVTSRAAIGEYQPRKKVDGERVADGDVIKGYYPPAVSEAVYYAAMNAVALRRSGGAGRRAKNTRNIFTGLLRGETAPDDPDTPWVYERCEPLYYYNDSISVKGKKKYTYHKLAPKSKYYRLAPGWTLDYDLFERMFLTFVKELDPRDFATDGDDTGNRVAELSGRLVEHDQRIRETKDAVAGAKGATLKMLLATLGELAENKELDRAELESLRAAATNHSTDAVASVQSLATMLADAGDDDAVSLRLRLRQYLRGFIRGIAVRYHHDPASKAGHRRFKVAVSVLFANGSRAVPDHVRQRGDGDDGSWSRSYSYDETGTMRYNFLYGR